ncbi:MAG: DUF4837 family protein [Gemmatimonadota bacterium]|nr:DUF4837 family protein [Gemmatimonadota bacterium]MDH5759650.1 DUF4837 family protein [Gemmatimonadota bacterium]
MPRKILLTLALLATAGAPSCSTRPTAYGDANSIIAVMHPDLWEQLSEEVYDALEPTIQTVRNEKTFTVTYQDPETPEWGMLQRFRQLLLVGTEDDPWIAQALEYARKEISAPGITQAYDVWSRGQQATIVLLSDGAAAEELRSFLPAVNDLLDSQFREYARNRMFMSGIDSALVDTLAMQARFSVLVPDVYRWSAQDSVYVFRNDNPDPAELIRQVAVTWRSPIPEGMSRTDVLAWRDQVANGYYNQGQMVDTTALFEEAGGDTERPSNQIQGIWKNPPDLPWPAAGPFITRVVTCPGQDRMYLVDAWLYAPGKEKYEYMIQLETILDSFRCYR